MLCYSTPFCSLLCCPVALLLYFCCSFALALLWLLFALLLALLLYSCCSFALALLWLLIALLLALLLYSFCSFALALLWLLFALLLALLLYSCCSFALALLWLLFALLLVLTLLLLFYYCYYSVLLCTSIACNYACCSPVSSAPLVGGLMVPVGPYMLLSSHCTLILLYQVLWASSRMQRDWVMPRLLLVKQVMVWFRFPHLSFPWFSSPCQQPLQATGVGRCLLRRQRRF